MLRDLETEKDIRGINTTGVFYSNVVRQQEFGSFKNGLVLMFLKGRKDGSLIGHGIRDWSFFSVHPKNAQDWGQGMVELKEEVTDH